VVIVVTVVSKYVIVVLRVTVGPGWESVSVRVVENRIRVPLTVLVMVLVIVTTDEVDWVIVSVWVGPVVVVNRVNVVVEVVKNPPPLAATAPTASAPNARARTTSEIMLLRKSFPSLWQC